MPHEILKPEVLYPTLPDPDSQVTLAETQQFYDISLGRSRDSIAKGHETVEKTRKDRRATMSQWDNTAAASDEENLDEEQTHAL